MKFRGLSWSSAVWPSSSLFFLFFSEGEKGNSHQSVSSAGNCYIYIYPLEKSSTLLLLFPFSPSSFRILPKKKKTKKQKKNREYERCVTVNLLCANVNNTITNAPFINYFPKTDTFLKRYIDNGPIYVKKLNKNAERVTFETSFRAYFGCFLPFLSVKLFSRKSKNQEKRRK
jgi:hypothetical protein